ncbi:PREDICTED: putative epidermal cell surface receptor isoform X3 [Polistes dominula]|uniref:Epidermal cell surface receptor isoform X3 n=1 Tax=Polistes dominula TaxID=743375 RepID=A0ABM1HVH0_POLDO|nr:PREDICTED: putative epidermal cell surface receptor isoform X3 [Polistes dominula]
MRILKKCSLCTMLAGLCLLSLLAVIIPSSSALNIETIPITTTTTMTTMTTTMMMTTTAATTKGTTTNVAENENILKVEPLETRTKNETFNSKSELLIKETDAKVSTEAKKKSVVDLKTKVEQKYQKSYKEDDGKSSTAYLASSRDNTESKSSVKKESTAIPLLFRGEVIATSSSSTMKIPDVTETSNLTEEKENTTIKITNEELGINEATLSSSSLSNRGRALNVTAPEPANSLHTNLTDLSDVSMDENDKEIEGGEYVVPHNETMLNVSSSFLPNSIQCIDDGQTYSMGDKIIRDCEEKCTCKEGGFIGDCKPLCISPYVRAGRGIHDPLCEEKLITEEPCCAILICAADSAPEPEETCLFRNKTISRGQRVEDGCSKVCICETGGNLKCEPRCPPNETTSIANQHDRCVELMDPRDSCCTITLCDVTLGDHEIKTENSTDLSVNLTDVKVLNSTAIKLKLSGKNVDTVTIEISDNNHVWRQQIPDKAGIISNLEPARTYYVRVIESGKTGPAIQVSLPAEVIKTNVSEKMFDKNSCSHRGKSYKLGAEWYDECISFCICAEGGKAECVTIQCPTDFGLDVLDPYCIDWETVPANFVPKAPQCCPQEVHCRNNGSCNYEGVTYVNWSELPSNVTGCEKRCYCEMGNVTCHATCPPVPALPPVTLQCPSQQATLMHLPGDDCCLHWACGNPSLQGMNATPAYPGPLATDTFNRQSIDDSKRLNNKSEMVRPSQEPEHGTSSLWEDSKNTNTYADPATTIHGLVHYPMDPGHPTVPYNGPYSPDYKPTHPTIDNVFHVSSQTEKLIPLIKDKSKSKLDSKKPVEPIKTHFPGPLSPDKFPDKIMSVPMQPNMDNQYIHSTIKPNKLPIFQKGVHNVDQPQFIPLNPHQESDSSSFSFVPNNGENIPPSSFNAQFDESVAGPPYHDSIPSKPDSIDPNVIIQMNSKKKTQIGDHFSDIDKIKTLTPILPGKPKQGQRNPEQEIAPDELYHFINIQHPGLIQLDHGPPQGHSGIYNLHQQIATQKRPSTNQIQTGYFGTPPPLAKKTGKPHIFTQKNENGQTTYHIHTPDIPNTPQKIEELLAHISQHDNNPGPFQHYPGQPPIPHNIPTGPQPSLPLHIDAHIPHSGLTHLNHPFAAQTPNQSGLDHNLPSGFPLTGGIPNFPASSSFDEVTVQVLEALDESTVRLVFTVPTILVGLHGRVELRYTSDPKNVNPTTWKSKVFAPPGDLIATPQLEFELDDLKPSTEYKVKIMVKLKDLTNSPMSKVYTVRTLEKYAEGTTLPPQIPIDAELRIMETNSSWINVMWKKFTDYELQFIDGVQLRYKEHDGKVYAATPLIHRSVTNYVIENLKPMTTYEIGIYFIPFPGQTTELVAEKTIHVTTFSEPDPYLFDVKVEIKTIKSTDVEVSWSGVPYPEDKYVNIYRAIYQSDSGKEDTSTFKIAKRDSPAKTIISDLKPGTRYRLWIEVYLTNGRIKKSNVQDFVTKPGILMPTNVPRQVGKLASIPLHEGDYYGPLVIVAIVASLAILSTLILLMMLMKRRTSSKADISPRKTTSAYDNPSYKVELQQETMDL